MCNIFNNIHKYYKDISLHHWSNGCKIIDWVKEVLGSKLANKLKVFFLISTKRVDFFLKILAKLIKIQFRPKLPKYYGFE